MKSLQSLHRLHWTRREFLQFLGMAGGATSATKLFASADKESPFPLSRIRPRPVFRLVRPHDLLCLQLELINLRVVAAKERGFAFPEIHLLSHGGPGYIVLHFPGQHIAEQAIWDRSMEPKDKDPNKKNLKPIDPAPPLTYRVLRDGKNNNDLDFLKKSRAGVPNQPQGLAGAWLCGPSQLVFEVSQGLLPTEFSTEAILDLCARQLPLVVPPSVDPDYAKEANWPDIPETVPEPWIGHHPIHETPPFSAIEFPSLLYLSPYRTARWRQRPRTGFRRSELWGFELEVPRTDSLLGIPRKLRAPGHLFAFAWRRADEAAWPIAERGAQADSQDKYGENERPKTSLYEATRSLLVKQLKENNSDITAHRLRLTTLGATARLQYRAAFETRGGSPSNGEGERRNVDSPEKRLERFQTGLKLIRYELSQPDRGVAEGIIKSNTDKPLAEVWALLRTEFDRLKLSTESWEIVGAVFKDINAPTDDDGLLLEWIQKTELGRDFYTKESFAGFWMPWGFKGEVVTITERLPCSHAIAQSAREDVSLAEQESTLTGFLVARKFCRVRPFRDGTLTRDFSSTESADFMNWLSLVGRGSGLKGVQILTDRTPVLANHAVNVFENNGAPDRIITALKQGQDLIVDDGSGRDAAREIFWPRVEDFVSGKDQALERRLVVYKFPVRLIYLDGTDQIINVPMFFTSNEAQGKAYYPITLELLRKVDINRQVPVVEPSPPAVFNSADFGSGTAVAKMADHLGNFMDGSVRSLINNNEAIGTASGLQVLAKSVNVFLDNLPNEIAQRLTVSRKDISDYLDKAAHFEIPPDLQSADAIQTLDRAWAKLETWMRDQVGQLSRNADPVLAMLQRAAAWGTEELGSVDSAVAAERLIQFLRLPQSAPKIREYASQFAVAKAVLKKAWAELEKQDANYQEDVGELLTLLNAAKASLDDLQRRLNGIPDASIEADKIISEYGAVYFKSVRNLAVQWSVRLARDWHREFWDAPFRKLAAIVDPQFPAQLFTAAIHKEMHYAVLSGKALFKIRAGEELTFCFENLGLLPENLMPGIRPEATAKDVSAIFATLINPAVKKAEALERILRGVASALPEERMLQQRLHWLLEQHARLAEKELLAEIHSIVADLSTHMTFALAHYSDGHTRLTRFLTTAIAGPEMVEQFRQRIGNTVDQLKETARKAVASQIGKVTNVCESLEKWIAAANPTQVKQRLQEIMDLTGGRVVEEITERLARVRGAATTLVSNVYADAERQTESVRRKVEQTRSNLEQVLTLAEGILGKHRRLVETFLNGAKGKALRETLASELKKLADSIEPNNVPVGVKKWLSRVIAQVEGRVLSPRLLLMLDDLATAVLQTARLPEEGLKRASEYRTRVHEALLTEVTGAQEFGDRKLKEFNSELQRLVGEADADLEARLQGITDLANAEQTKWMDFLDHLFVAFSTIPEEFKASLDAAISAALDPIKKSVLQQALGERWQDVQRHLDELRGLVGDAQDFGKAIGKLPADVKDRADESLKNLRGELKNLAESLSRDLTYRAENVEGEVFGFVKRALVSLRSPALLDNFSDQTRKAVFTARDILFTVASVPADFEQSLRALVALPRIESFSVKLPGVEGFKQIAHTEGYLKSGLRDFEAAKGQVFANLKEAVQAASEAAGIGAAASQIQALSREAGALSQAMVAEINRLGTQTQKAVDAWARGQVGALKDAIKDAEAKLKAQAKSLLGDPPPKLFNVVDLTKVLGMMRNPDEIPKAIAKEFPDRIEHTLGLRKDTERVDAGVVIYEPKAGRDSELKLESRMTAWLPLPGQPRRGVSSTVRGQLGPFRLVIGSIVALNFKSLTFVGENGQFKCHPKLGKADNTEGPEILGAIEFLGPLAFLQDVIKQFTTFLSGKLPFQLDFDGEIIFAGLQIALPSLGFGAFSMENLALGMAVGLPVSKGKPLVYKFNISDRIETFKIAVCGFTGGGFFEMQISSDPAYGSIAAALEFGGSLSANLAGIAKGSLSVMAGIYYKKQGSQVMLDAYLRACGVLVILGFIDICIVFYLALQYRSGALSGEASVTVRVKIAFFSKSFRLRYTKTIAGSNKSGSNTARYEAPRWGKEYLIASLEPPPGILRDVPDVRVIAVAAERPTADMDIASKPHPKRFTDRVNADAWKEYWSQFDPSPHCGSGRRYPAGGQSQKMSQN